MKRVYLEEIFGESLRTSLVAQAVKCLSTMRETQVQSLGREDPLEKEMAAHSSTIEDTVLVDPRVFFLTRSSNAATKVPAGHN